MHDFQTLLSAKSSESVSIPKNIFFNYFTLDKLNKKNL